MRLCERRGFQLGLTEIAAPAVQAASLSRAVRASAPADLHSRLAARHRRVVEALAPRRQEVRMRYVSAATTCADCRRLHKVAVAQLRQNDFQRPPKSIQHAHRILQRSHACSDDIASRDCLPQTRTSPARIVGESGTSRVHPRPTSARERLLRQHASSLRRHNSALHAETRRPRLRARRSLR